MGSTKLTIAKVTQALMLSNGIIKNACERCGVARNTMLRFIEENSLEDVRKEALEQLKDTAEDSIFAAIRAGDLKTVRWWLERKAKERGYTTRVETTGPDGSPIEFDEIKRTYEEEPDSGEGEG